MEYTGQQLAIMVILAMISVSVDAYGYGIANNWEKSWKRVKPDEAEASTAKFNLGKALTASAEARKTHLASNDAPAYLKPVDLASDRMQPLCALKFARFEGDKYEMATCTCAFLKPKLAVTAAHCFLKGLVGGVKKTDAVYVVQQYGAKGDNHNNHAQHLILNNRRVIEWWVPSEYSPIQGVTVTGDKHSAYDVGFLRLASDAPVQKFYTLRPPKGKLGSGESYDVYGKKIQVVGYPGKYKGSEVAVRLPGILKNEEQCDLQPDQECHWGVADDNSETASEGDSGECTSGGPFMLSDKGVAQMGAIGEKLKLSLFSVVGYPVSHAGGVGGKVTKPEFKNAVGGLLVTQALVDVVDKIDKYQPKSGAKPPLDGMGREDVLFD